MDTILDIFILFILKILKYILVSIFVEIYKEMIILHSVSLRINIGSDSFPYCVRSIRISMKLFTLFLGVWCALPRVYLDNVRTTYTTKLLYKQDVLIVFSIEILSY